MSPNRSAFPYHIKQSGDYGLGLTKREYFASQVLSGYLAAFAGDISIGFPDPKIAAQKAVEYADALINELDKP